VGLRNYLRSFAKDRAIRTYTRKLPRLLSAQYGKRQFPTPQQVKKAAENAGLNTAFSCYAATIFSSRESFNQFHREIGEACDYDAMRAHVANTHFGGGTYAVGAESHGGSRNHH